MKTGDIYMNFDKEINSIFKENIVINYGIINGNSKIVFIKTGQDGSIYGYENKYLRIARNLNSKYGYTVICSSNPFDGSNPLEHDFEVIEKYSVEKSFENYDIYYIGHSNGARIGMTWGYQYPKIKKMLLINSPIFINWHKLKEGLKNSSNQEIYLIYGEYDQSIKYTELLEPLLNENIKLEIINGADHNFTNMLEEFIELSEKFLN